jgi:hypothetical protein
MMEIMLSVTDVMNAKLKRVGLVPLGSALVSTKKRV